MSKFFSLFQPRDSRQNFLFSFDLAAAVRRSSLSSFAIAAWNPASTTRCEDFPAPGNGRNQD
jgi:hypothetical protein